MHLSKAKQIVTSAIWAVTGLSGHIDASQMLRNFGITDANRCDLFRMSVLRGIRNSGYQIDPMLIPAEPYHTVEEVVMAIASLAGRPTTGNDI